MRAVSTSQIAVTLTLGSGSVVSKSAVNPAFAIDADCRKVELSVRRGGSAEVTENQRRAGGGLEEVATGGQGLWHGVALRGIDKGARQIGEGR